MDVTNNIQAAVLKVIALRKLTLETGTITRRAQGKILQALTDEELAVAAEILSEESNDSAL